MSSRGFWILLDPPGRELYLPFTSFPWFAEATIRQLCNIQVQRQHLLCWPDLDVDLDVDRIEHPERYPLVAAAISRKGAHRSAARRSADERGRLRPKKRTVRATGAKRARGRAAAE